MFCRNCGGGIQDDSKFCNYCGSRVLILDETKAEALLMSSDNLVKETANMVNQHRLLKHNTERALEKMKLEYLDYSGNIINEEYYILWGDLIESKQIFVRLKKKSGFRRSTIGILL